MIIDADLLENLGIDVCLSNKYMRWEVIEFPMKYKNTITNRNTTQLVYHLAIEPPILQEAEEQHDRILDAYILQ
jgi:hypothetical protein